MSENAGDGQALLDQLGQMIRLDGLSDLLAGFNDAGEESKVQSWVGSGENEPTEPDAVKRAIGRTRITAMAERLGVGEDRVAAALAALVPTVVDNLTPGGRLPTGAQLDQLDIHGLAAGVDLGSLLS